MLLNGLNAFLTSKIGVISEKTLYNPLVSPPPLSHSLHNMLCRKNPIDVFWTHHRLTTLPPLPYPTKSSPKCHRLLGLRLPLKSLGSKDFLILKYCIMLTSCIQFNWGLLSNYANLVKHLFLGRS